MKNQEILQNIRQRLGIDELNGMQKRMSQLDVTGAVTLTAPTGSGKTIAFSIPFIRSLGVADGKIRGVVIAPSRELVLQIADVIRPVASEFKTVTLYGGHSVADEENSLSVVPDIIIATPGRLLDHVKRGNVSLADVVSVVLDEYDKSLELGFADEMKRLVRKMTRARFFILTSATPMAELPDYFPKMKRTDIEVEDENKRGTTMIFKVISPSRDKLDTLVELLRGMDNSTAIIFVNHRDSAERVYERLKREGLPVGLYHGGLQQNERENALEMLANGTTPILVSTDLAARGIDIPALGSVIHYHLPVNEATWTHRNGRTARQDADGLVYVMATDEDTMPDFVVWDKEVYPSAPSADPIVSDTATLYLNVGKKEKISRGDIVGFLVAKGGLDAKEIGRISLRDHSALVAVPRESASTLLQRISSEKIKNTRAKFSLLK